MSDANNYLTSIGVVVKVNNVAVAGATEYSDIGGAPSTIDATKLTDTVRVNKTGVQEQDAFDITFLFNNNLVTSDFRVLKALEGTHNVPVSVEFPDGTKASNTGDVSVYASGGSVGTMLTGHCVMALDGQWTWTNPSSST